MTELSEINAISILEDFKSGNNENKIAAIKNVSTIILCLGKTRTINEFIPFLIEFCEEEDDIIIIELNSQLKTIADFVGKANFQHVFELWIKIALIEENSIIKSSITAFNEIISYYDDTKSRDYLLKNYEFLFQNKNYILLLNSILITIKRFPSIQMKLIKFVKDISELVDYNSSLEILKLSPNFAEQLSHEDITTILNNVNKTCEYEYSIKFNIIKPLGQVLCIYSNLLVKENKSQSELKQLKDLAISILSIDDIKVKKAIIENCLDYATFNDPSINTIIYDVINSATLNQQDIEQKNTVCKNLVSIFKGFKIVEGNTYTESLLKTVQTLTKDANLVIRKSLANNILKICPYISKNAIIDNLFPIFLELIKDDNMEVRIELLTSMEDVNPYLSIEDSFNSIYPQLLEIAQSKSWRVRFQLTTLYKSFVNVLSQNLFIAKVFPIYLNWLSDPVYAIRKEGARLINEILKKYPIIVDDVFAQISELKESKSYLLRVTLAYLIECFTLDSQNKLIVEKHLIPLVLELAKSNTSNIVINCEKTIKELQHIKEVKAESQFIFNLINKYKNQ